MRLAGKTVRFSLTDGGKCELPRDVFGDSPLEVVVIDGDPAGVWVWVQREESGELLPEVMLLKWEHFATALTSYEVPPTAERPAAGFRPS
jgi:hypothetical protein